MKKAFQIFVLLAVFTFGNSLIATAGGPPGGNIWAGGSGYMTVATPAFLPNHGPKDGLFVFEGLDGQDPVAESEPGDKSYNGGRWQVYVLEFTDEGKDIHDADGDGTVDFELKSWDMVESHINLGHIEFVGMGPSFVCPLIK